MKNKIKEIAQLRADRQAAEDVLDKIHSELDNSELGKRYLAAQDKSIEIGKSIKTAEAAYKADCVANFERDEHFPGGNFKSFEVLVYDEAEALKWVMEHGFDKALKLKKSEFKKIAKATEPDCVTFTSERRFSLQTDLTEFLENDDN